MTKKIILSISLFILFFSFLIIVNKSPEINVPGEEQRFAGAIQYLHKIKSNERTGRVDLSDIYSAKSKVNEMKMQRSSQSVLEWEEMGPNNVGGRTRAILIDKNNPDIIYAGAVSGGLWVSYSGGRAWQKYSPELSNVNISSITQAPNGDIYFGTGEMYFAKYSSGSGESGFVGNGLWKKSANSSSFEQKTGVMPGSNNSSGYEWSGVYEMLVDPNNSNRVFASTGSGLKLSEDAGNTWVNVGIGPTALTSTDIQVSSDGSYYMASINNMVYYSDDGSVGTFVSRHAGLPTGNLGRTEISISPSNPNYVYCAISNNSGNGDMIGIYRSTDRGQSWEAIALAGITELNIFSSQARYDMLIGVHPTNPDILYVGGLDLWMWNSGQWEKLTQWFFAGFPQFTNYLHADQHTIVFHPDNPNIFYVGNDGGVFRTEDGGHTFKHMNRGYNVTQFYSVGFSKYGEVVGGTQDNGTQLVGWKAEYSNSDIVQGVTPQAGFEIRGGDGGYCDFSRINPDVIFMETQYGDAARSFDKGMSFSTTFAGEVQNFIDAQGAPFVTPFRLWESYNVPNNPDKIRFVAQQDYMQGDVVQIQSNTVNYPINYVLDEELFTGDTLMIADPLTSMFAIGINGQILMTRDALSGGVTDWHRLANITGAPQCMEFSIDGDNLFVGTSNGRLYRISNLKNAWSDDDCDIVLATNYIVNVDLIETFSNRAVTGISIDPNNENNLFISLGNYGNSDYVHKSSNILDANPSFMSVQGDLPEMPVYDVLVNVKDSDQIFVATEYGVWSSSFPFSDWSPEDNGLGNQPCFMIRQQYYSNPSYPNNISSDTIFYSWLNDSWINVNNEYDYFGQIYVATHGRGMFKSSSFSESKNTEFVPISNLISNSNKALVYPNPTSDFVSVSIDVNSQNENVLIYLFDVQGKLLNKFEYQNLIEGNHDKRIDLSDLNQGIYILKVSIGDQVFESKIIKK